jgi:hypothetical protein
MANNYWLTQAAICENEFVDSSSEIFIDEKEFAELLLAQWSAIEYREFGQNIWEYELKSTNNQRDFTVITLVNHTMVSELRFKKLEWVQICKLLQAYLQCPIFLSNDSNPENCLKITSTTTQDDILLWLERH